MMDNMHTEDHYAIVQRYFSKRVNDAQVAKDLTQDVFLKIIQSRDQFDNIKNFSGWVITIAHNRLIDYYRAKKTFTDIQEISIQADESEGDVYEALEKCLKVFIKELGDEDRYIIESIDLKGKSQKDLSREWGLPEPTMRSKVQRARKKLHRRFIDICYFSPDHMGSPQACELKKPCDC